MRRQHDPFSCQLCAISKTNVQTSACVPDQVERAAPAFYLAILISRDLRPTSGPVMSGNVNSGPESGNGNADANDPIAEVVLDVRHSLMRTKSGAC